MFYFDRKSNPLLTDIVHSCHKLCDIFKSYNEGLGGVETGEKGINLYFTSNFIIIIEFRVLPCERNKRDRISLFFRRMKKLPRNRAI